VTIPEDKRDPGILDKLEAEGSGYPELVYRGAPAVSGERLQTRAPGGGRRGNGTVPVGIRHGRAVPGAGDEDRPDGNDRADRAV